MYELVVLNIKTYSSNYTKGGRMIQAKKKGVKKYVLKKRISHEDFKKVATNH